jgi:translation initiation factor IF-3
LGKNIPWQINERVKSGKLRLIGSDNKQIGIVTKEEALDRAKKESLDLVEIAPNAKPPVVRIVDFGKFLYEEEKKLKKQKKKTKTSELKEVRFSPFIAENDFNTRIERIKEFLEERNKVRLVVKFKGRQMSAKKFGYDILDRALESLGDFAKVDMEPKFIGRHLIMVISPTSNKKKKTEKKEKKEKKEEKNAKAKN